MSSPISKNLRVLRKKHHLTQQNVADLIRKDRSMVAKYETGQATPPIETLQMLADLYRVSFSTICSAELDDNTMVLQNAAAEESDDLSFGGLTSEERMLIMRLRTCGPATMEEVFDVINEDLL